MPKIKNLNTSVLVKNPGQWQTRLIIGTPTTGLVRVEWMIARYGAVIPTNWSQVDVVQYMSSFVPLEYQVADAENLIVKQVIDKKAEWLLFIEHDNVIPPDTFMKMNQYMIEKKYPVVGGLYFTKSVPPEPILYREDGFGYFDKWKMGDKVMVRELPFGCTLIHASILQAMWDESPEYTIGNVVTRRVFEAPNMCYKDPEKDSWYKAMGTTDIAWCKRIINDNYFVKAGWPKFQKKKYPFLVDTTIFVKHIDVHGVQWPIAVPEKFLPDPKKTYKGPILSK